MEMLWSELRTVITQLERDKDAALAEARTLRLERAAHSSPPIAMHSSPIAAPILTLASSSPTFARRPDSGSSVAEVKARLQEYLDSFTDRLDEDALSRSKIWDMPQAFALRLLTEKRDPQSEQAYSAIRCWMKTPDANRYPKVNLRNTRHHTGVGTYDTQAFLHHLAVIAKGSGGKLRSVLHDPVDGEQYQVSHLCHNERCFNPDHVEIEAAVVNQARKACAGTRNINCSGCKARYVHCAHNRMDGSCGRKCIVGTFVGTGRAYHRRRLDGDYEIDNANTLH